MMYNLGFYIHHQGTGHLIRALTIAEALKHDFKITFLGSALDSEHHIPDFIERIHLAYDYDEMVNDDAVYPSVFHYAPLGVAGIRNRSRQIVDWFNAAYPCILIVDVSVEITLLARLCGIPTIVMRLHGKRDDAAHLAAYSSASLLIAPFGEELEDPETPAAVRSKTFYSGGFSRYSYSGIPCQGSLNEVCILPGGGGSSLTHKIVSKIACELPEKQFYVLAQSPEYSMPENLTYTGWQNDPRPWLERAAYLIGSAGDNGTMEAASLKRRFICIIENRPFNEQEYKSRNLERLRAAVAVQDVSRCNWKEVFQDAELLDPENIGRLIYPEALEDIRKRVLSLAEEIFNNPNDLY
ncbi:MAG: hypothetical protein INR69_11075 [Mucilaginibacter polytrichastri]|nr:hypothetical protein [Mucilaginibacter polytrichastri]